LLTPDERSVLDSIASHVLEIQAALGSAANPTGQGRLERTRAVLPKPGTAEHDALPPEVQAAILTLAGHVPGSYGGVEPSGQDRLERLRAVLPEPGTTEHDALPPEVQAALLTIAAHVGGSYGDVDPPHHKSP
jgi:hypothetical protein